LLSVYIGRSGHDENFGCGLSAKQNAPQANQCRFSKKINNARLLMAGGGSFPAAAAPSGCPPTMCYAPRGCFSDDLR
jgi:hypothetical protein